MIIKFKKGGNTGKIMKNNEKYLAVTAVKSKWYKTLKGAKNFMNKKGYTEVK